MEVYIIPLQYNDLFYKTGKVDQIKYTEHQPFAKTNTNRKIKF